MRAAFKTLSSFVVMMRYALNQGIPVTGCIAFPDTPSEGTDVQFLPLLAFLIDESDAVW